MDLNLTRPVRAAAQLIRRPEDFVDHLFKSGAHATANAFLTLSQLNIDQQQRWRTSHGKDEEVLKSSPLLEPWRLSRRQESSVCVDRNHPG